MSRTVVVRFRDVNAQPNYRATHPRDSPYIHGPGTIVDSQAGQPVTIELPPVIALPHVWECGVERVWRLTDEEVIRLTGIAPPLGKRICVCEHQIDVD